MIKLEPVKRAVQIQKIELQPSDGLIVLLDSDDDCPVQLCQEIRELVSDVAAPNQIEVVAAHRMFESWFLAAASSLSGHREMPDELIVPDAPESIQGPKRWLTEQMHRRSLRSSYSPTRHQATFAARMDLELARIHSPSFDKLYRTIAEWS